MAGLFDILTGGGSPEQNQMLSAVAQGLLSANGSQGLGNAMGLLNQLPDVNLKRQDLAQQIQLRNIQLQQSQQEWAAIQPALAAYAARQAGGTAPAAGGASGVSQPAIAPTAGGPLGSGTAGIDIGGQPARSAPPVASSGGAAGAADPFGLDNIIQGRVINLFGGQPAATAFWDRAKLPDAVKTNNYYGLSPDTVQASMLREAAAKGQTLVRQGSTLGRTNADGSFTPFFTAPDTKDNANITWQNGSPVASMIPGLLPGIRSVAKAQTAGAGEVTPFVGVDAKGNPLPVTNRTAAATQGQAAAPEIAANDPNIPPSTPYDRAASDVGAIQREIAGVQKSMAPAATKQGQLDILNAELAKAQSAQAAAHVDQMFTGSASDVLARIAALPAQAQGPAIAAYKAQSSAPAAAPTAAPGAIYAAPPLGTVSNSDTSQKARANSMETSYGRLQSAGSTASMAIDALDKMMALAANKNPVLTAGVLGTHQSAVNTDAAEYEKQRANVIALMSQQLGAGVTDSGRANIGESVPDFGKPKAAIADGLGTLRSQLVMQQMKRDMLAPIYQGGDSNKYTTLENQFDQNISPAMVPTLKLSGDAQRNAVKAAVQANPALRPRFEWAFNNGLLK